jgi:hypothetical protein
MNRRRTTPPCPAVLVRFPIPRRSGSRGLIGLSVVREVRGMPDRRNRIILRGRPVFRAGRSRAEVDDDEYSQQR